MPKFTILSSETVGYRTEIEAESEDKALNIFYHTRITDQSKLAPEFYEGFQVDSVCAEDL